jgi:hypothetical protein
MENTEIQVPDNFRSIINDFTNDLSITFPEHVDKWSMWRQEITEADLAYLFNHCLRIYPERFFDILYQNDDIFKTDSSTNTDFLPGIDFKILFNCQDISDKTKKTMWKYLQLILFTVVGSVKDKSKFGDTMNMFEGINENDLNEKLNETMSSLSDFFQNISKNMDEDEAKAENGGGERDNGENSNGESGEKRERPDFSRMFENMPNMANMPDIAGIQEHLKTLFNGKIGELARDMAEEISGDFSDLIGDNMGDVKSADDVLKNLLKDPKKVMKLMKSVSGKLDSKMSNGEISKEDLMKEASELFSKMKDMGGTSQFNELFKNLTKNMGGLAGMAGMGGLGKNMKIDTNALSRMSARDATRERLRKKMADKKEREAAAAATNASATTNFSLETTQNPDSFVFRLPDEEQQMKSYIHPDILAEMEAKDAKDKIRAESGGNGGGGNKKKKNKGKKK